MSLHQAIIGSTVRVTPPVTYPAPGSNYPAGAFTTIANTSATVSGYYEWPLFISTNPINGLWRRTYTGMALNGTYCETNFPSDSVSYPQVRSELDAAVGFGYAPDSATAYTMEWLGYFVPGTDGDFVFGVNSVDDYMMMWIGASAVSGSDNNNYLWKASGATASSPKVALMSGRYYPVRIRYTEGSGGNEFAFVSGLDGQLMTNNNADGRSGVFKTDDRTNVGAFPNSGLIT